MKKILCGILALAVLFSSLGTNLVFAAPDMTTNNGFLDVEAEDLSFDKDFLQKTEKNKLYSNSYGLSIKDEDKTEPAADDPAHLDLSFTADKAGTYTIWMRHTASVADMSGQNVFLSVAGGKYTIAMLTAGPEEPAWVKLATVTAASDGEEVSVKIRRRQCNKIVLDRFIITNDTSYVPDDYQLGIAGATPRPSATPSGPVETIELEDGTALFEAEEATVISDFVEVSDNDASGQKALNIDGDHGTKPAETDPAQIEFNFKADQDGTYVLWVYAKPTTPNKSMAVSVDNEAYKVVALNAPENAYEWRKLVPITGVKAGDTVNVRLRAATGYFRVDQFILLHGQDKKPVGVDAQIEEYDATKLDETLYPKPGFTPPPEHPRLYFTKDDIPTILENATKMQNEEAWRRYREMLEMDIQDGILPAPQPGTMNVNNQSLGTIEAWAFNYVTEGNEEYGRKAIEAIQNYMDTLVLIDPNNDNYTRNGGHAIFTLSEVYDWCYPLLSEDDKSNMINQVIELIQGGVEVGWPPVKQGSVTSHGSEAQILRDLNAFAIAVYDERPDIYNVVVGRFLADYVPARMFTYPSHMFHQGSGYGSYRGQWDFNATWIFDRMGQERIFGDDQQYTAYWFLYLRRPDGQLMRDGDATTNGSEIGAYSNDLKRIMMLAGNYYQDPYLKQEAMRSNPYLSTFAYGHGNMSPVEFLIFNDPDLWGRPLSELPQTKYFGSPQGAMIARTGWNDGLDSPDAMAYMKINEIWFANHHHLDAGSFQLYYKGILANDSGRYQGYGTDQDLAYNKRSIAHNTITVYDPNETGGYYNMQTNDGGQEVKEGGSEHAHIDFFKNGGNETGKVEGHEFGPDQLEPDYSYLKGDITKAYNSSKMEDYERSFLFLDLKNDTNPAALIVFDRVRSSNEDFKKAWLLHGPTEPEVDGNRTVFRNTENGYNGKMTVDTLLPKADNTEINVIGGPGQEAWVVDKNYSAGTELDMTKAHESDGWRIEVSPKTAQKQDYFLNVLQVGDAEPDTPALPTTLIETDTHVGAQIADRVALFSLEKGRTKEDITFSFSGEGTYKIMVADVEAGTYRVMRDGAEVATAVASEEGGLLNFEGEAGTYTITYVDAAADKQFPEPTPKVDEGITLRIANKFVYTDVAPTLVNDRTLVPMRVIFEKLGATVDWDEATRTVTANKDGRTIQLTIDNTTALVDGKEVTLDVPAMQLNDRTMVPVRFIAETLNCKVDWDGFAQTVYVSNPSNIIGQVDENGNIYYPPQHDIPNALPIYELYQNDSDENRIEQSIDGDLSTRWAVEGTQNWAWGTYDLGSVKTLDKAYLAFHNGHERVYTFSLDVSEDGENWTRVIDQQTTSGTTLELEAYDMKGVKARYVKFLGDGNTVNMWNSLTEIVFTEKK